MLSQKQKKIQTLLRSLNVLPKDERKKYTIKDLKKVGNEKKQIKE